MSCPVAKSSTKESIEVDKFDRPTGLDSELETLDVNLQQRDDWRSRKTVTKLLNGWNQISKEVGGGYRGMTDDYIHDLYHRDHLAIALNHATGELLAWLNIAVDSIDDVFRQNTEVDSGRLLAGQIRHFDAPDEWWNRRLPLDRELQTALTQLYGPDLDR